MVSTGKRIFLTFDMDWADDEVLDHLFKLMEDQQLTGTINVTHKTGFIERCRNSDVFELGIHPNYNKILLGDEGSVDTVLSEIKAIVPEAQCCRSHSLTMSSIILSKYSEYGIKYDLNNLIPLYDGLSVRPYISSINQEVIILPFIFEDDEYLNRLDKTRGGLEFFLDNFNAPMIFNFHPIHIFLNTHTISDYYKAKPYLHDYQKLQEFVNTDEYGIRDLFIDIIKLAKAENYTFHKISEGNWI